MLLEDIAPDILLLHILPHLSTTDTRSLAATNTHLAVQLMNHRFARCNVRSQSGYVRMTLHPSTVRTIRELTLNGSEAEHDDMFGCGDLEGVVSAVVVTRITDRQKGAFGVWARRLQRLSERKSSPGDQESSLSGMQRGAIEQLHSLRLEISLPTGLFSMVQNLRFIQFLPKYNTTSAIEYLDYVSELDHLLSLAADFSRFPALRLIQATPAPVIERFQKRAHLQLLITLWTSSHTHGNWKLLCQKPTEPASSNTWKSHWDDLAWGFCVRVKEFAHLTGLCHQRNIYPRLRDFITGKIHVHTAGGTVALGKLCDTAVYGVLIRHGNTTNMTAALQLITPDTRVLTIALERHWGSVGDHVATSIPYQRLEEFRITGPTPALPGDYTKNYSAAFIHAVDLPQWPALTTLSLPAIAFQKRAGPGIPYPALCGLHMRGYDMSLLSSLHNLRALWITEWTSCANCFLHPKVAFENCLQAIPSGVEYVGLSGRIGYYRDAIPKNIAKLAVHIVGVLQTNNPDVQADLADLWVRRISELFVPFCEEMDADCVVR